MNVKKMFASLTGVLMLASMATPLVTGAATYSEELQGAYEYAYSKGITTMSPIDNANMYGELTRGQLSKMISNWAESELGRTVDETAVCSFTDTNTAEGDLATYVVKACQMGLMGQGITAFRPNDKVTRGEFGTTLSRAIWGDKYDGANPYYANHLAALSQEGIMTKISEPNNLEIRGWVMLMLQRAATTVAPEECKDAAVVMACALDPESDACPAACRKPAKDNETTDTNKGEVVKSGDLSVSAAAATEKKAILDGGVSDLDTITLKASEPITVNSITLERFGYSTAADVDAVWLEDGDGNKIADEKSLSTSKDTVVLKIKKEYREMDANNAITVVLRTAKFTADYSGSKVGSTIGFKVTDVDASAKNLDISDYNPYTYDLVSYDGSKVTVSVKGNDKTYNYEEGAFYEVSRLKVKAGASILSVHGVTLTNKGTGSNVALDLDEFVKDVKVTADGKDVNGLKFNVTKDNELVLSWDTIDVEINKDVQIVVSIAMENLDEFGKVVRLVVKENGDLNATEKKTGARVTVTKPAVDDSNWKIYTFNGSKIKFSNTKLSSTIDAAQGSEDVVIAKGKVTVGEEVKISELVFNADLTWIIEDMTLTVAGESYDASVSSGKTVFTFKNVIMEESGDFELNVDVVDEDNSGKTVAITYKGSTSIWKTAFTGSNARYEDSREYVKEADVSGSISISKLRVQESKASLKNNNSKTVEFVRNETSDRTTVFKGTYTAKKSDITLKEFAIVGDAANIAKAKTGDTTAEFYIYINGEEVGMIDEGDIQTAVTSGFDSYEDFDEVEIAAGKSVDVEVKAVISPDKDAENSNINLDLYLRWEDSNGTAAGFAKAGLNTFKYVMNGSITISDSTTMSKKTVALQDNEITIAKFTLKPSKSDSVKLDNMIFDLSGLVANVADADNNVTVTVDGTDIDIDNDPAKTTGIDHVYFDGSDVDDIEEEVEVTVKVVGLTSVASGTVDASQAKSITLVSVNGVTKNSTYSRLILPAIVTVDSQESDGAVTKFKVNVEDYDGGQISNLKFYTASLGSGEGEAGNISNGQVIEVSNQSTAQVVNKVTFTITQDTDVWDVTLTNTDFPDFFKTADGKTLRVSKVD